MSEKTLRWINIALAVIGCVIMVWGTATRNGGAAIIGLIVAAINVRRLYGSQKKQ